MALSVMRYSFLLLVNGYLNELTLLFNLQHTSYFTVILLFSRKPVLKLPSKKSGLSRILMLKGIVVAIAVATFFGGYAVGTLDSGNNLTADELEELLNEVAKTNTNPTVESTTVPETRPMSGPRALLHLEGLALTIRCCGRGLRSLLVHEKRIQGPPIQIGRAL